ELPSELQPKLLRVLESRTVQRVGSSERLPIDVRVIAATNRNLKAEVNARRFRSDLYFRIAVLEITLPPLRQCLEDVPIPLAHMLEGSAASRGATALGSPKMIAEMQGHHWPGNVRELRNYVERCLAFDEPVPLAPGSAPVRRGADPTKPFRAERDRC